jgi:ABC-type branched-subunit amino acid transport system substrate-binding protein
VKPKWLAALMAIAMVACSVHSGVSGLLPPDKAVRTAADTDRGLTPTTITLGVLVYKRDSFAQFGVSSFGGKSPDQILKPFVDELNQRGGVAGRQVVVKTSAFSPLVPADQQVACVDQADDKKVFLTIGIVLFTADGERCLASHQTPVVTSNASSLASLKSDAGWVRQTSMAKDRVAKDWVDWLVGSQTATPATRIGVIHADNPEDNGLTGQVLVPYLKQRGLNVVAEAAFSGTTVDTVTAQAQSAVLKFKDAHVDLVLPALDFLRTYVFVGAANAAQFSTRYSISDLGQLSINATTNFFPASFNGTQGVTAYVTGLGGVSQVPDTPAIQNCLGVYQAHGGQLSTGTLDRLVEQLEIAQFCEHLSLVARVAELAGPHLNRASFLDAFARLGRWSDRVTLTGPLTYSRTKFDGPDDYAVIRWQAACGQGDTSCFQQVKPFERGRW